MPSQVKLEKHIKVSSEGNKLKLLDLCKTRWVGKIATYKMFDELLPYIVESFEVISTEDGWNVESCQIRLHHF